MLPDRVSNPGPLTYESGALPIALRGPAWRAEEGRLLLLLFSIVTLFCYSINERYVTLANTSLYIFSSFVPLIVSC